MSVADEIVSWGTTGILFGVLGFMLYCLIRYRKEPPGPLPPGDVNVTSPGDHFTI